ncbi:hypothetical protein SMAC4_13660 [Sordaria macrospora]|uniref:uncharacterized protein n=1 Tax=Sordaria macrospora TaxID=5147 RepID=UPI002B28B464|nr:hypothetical protein SMAC4_13660 [Sordaria macrospora]
MLPEQIPYGYYTDVIFSFATIDPNSFEIKAGDSKTADYMQRISAIKLIQPDIRIWIAVGGWAFNDPGPTQTTFSDIAASSANTKKFIDSLVQLMNKYGFDGIDIDWEYPVAEDRSGRGTDYKNFVTFQKALYDRMKGGGLKKQVSLTLPASYWYLQHFDIVNLEKYVDWFNIMSYDMHGSWDIDNKWTGPFVNSHSNMTEIQQALDLLWRNNIKPAKVTFGMAFYSRSFALTSSSCNTPGCGISSGGNAGKCSGTTGVLLHAEIQDEIAARKLTPTLHREAAVKSVSWGDQWVSFDDAATWRLKANIIRGQCIPGVMVWAMSQDDKDGTNIKALTSSVGRKQMAVPNFTIKQPVRDLPQPVKTCRWSGCYSGCPDGFKAVQRDGHKEAMLSTENCLADGMSVFCCPSDQDLPVCTWRGHRNSGACQPGCNSGEVSVGSLRVGCSSRHQSACCTNVGSTSSYGMCKWVGEAPTCNKGCPSDFPNKIVSTNTADGGEQPCVSGNKHYCCQNPTPADFTNCEWVKKGNPAKFPDKDFICEDVCGSDRIKVATEVTNPYSGTNSGCFGGAWAYCCKPPVALVPRGDDDPYGGVQNKEFQTLLEDYMQNPTCPATVLFIDPGDMFTGAANQKRSLELEAAEHRVLYGRAKDCKLDHYIRLTQYAALMLTAAANVLKQFSVVWNDIFAGHYDTELEADNLRTYFNRHPDILDPHSLINYVLLNPLRAGPGIRQNQRTEEMFCHYVGTRRKRDVQLRSSSTAVELASRHVWWMEAGNNGQPSMAVILEGILNGDLSPHYARWQWIDGARRTGPMLEMAYWIGPNAGQPSGSQYDRYRDTHTLNHGEPDRWVVFHFHINADFNSYPYLWETNGHTYIGVQSIQVFHAHESTGPTNGGAWRVQGNSNADARTQRDGFVCPEDELWYIGTDEGLPSGSDQLQRNLRQWAQNLFNEGYLSSESIALIMRDLTFYNNGEINVQDSSNADFMSYWAPNPRYQQSMYTINWVRRYDTFILSPTEPPPQSPTRKRNQEEKEIRSVGERIGGEGKW